jgi:SAM-dependent methyltransferase
MLKMRKLVRRILTGRKKRTPAKAPFAGVAPYWERRYAEGGASGTGSVGRLAEFKAQVLNEFVEHHGIQSILELGCGDGSQLALARYPSYVGVDVSQTALDLCRSRFAGDPSKRFFHYSERGEYAGSYDLILSVDVIFHLVEDRVYQEYVADLQRHARRFIIIYSSNYEDDPEHPWAPHVRHRKFSDDLDSLTDRWRFLRKVDNPYPFDPADQDNTSFSDFYIYERNGNNCPETN